MFKFSLYAVHIRKEKVFTPNHHAAVKTVHRSPSYLTNGLLVSIHTWPLGVS